VLTKADRVDWIADGLAAGKTLRALGQELGVSGERVRQIVRDFGMQRPPKPRKTATESGERRKRGRPPGACHAARMECKAAGLPDPYSRYMAQARLSVRRGISFKLTFDQWWELWRPHYANRGSRRGQMVMARYLDSGAYEIGNVTIKTVLENAHERSLSTNLRRVRWKKNSYNTSRFVPSNSDDDVPECGPGELRPEDL